MHNLNYHKEKIKNTFNRASHCYDDHASIQQQIGFHLQELVQPYHRPNSTIIDLGCGTGITTQQLANRMIFRELHAIDIAESSLAIAKQRMPQSNIKIYFSDFDHLPADTSHFDLIFSNMALHWSDHIHSTIVTLTKRLTLSGMLAFSIPINGTFHELLSHNFYSCRTFIHATSIKKTCAQNGLFCKSWSKKTVLQFKSTHHTLRSIKNTGATYVNKKNHKGLVGKSFLMHKKIHSLTYNIGYFLIRTSPL